MNSFRKISSVITLLLMCVSLNILSAQIIVDKTLTTFDKLSKTIIPFETTKKPTVVIEPSLEGLFTVEYANGKGQIVVRTPVTAGKYTVTFTNDDKTASVAWKVLPSTLDRESLKNLDSLHLYYGQRLVVQQKLLAESDLPLDQFIIEHQIGNIPRLPSPYTDVWVGPYLSTTKRVSWSVVWRYPPTGERITLFEKTIVPQQMPPNITSHEATVKIRSYDPSTGIATVTIDGLTVPPMLMGVDDSNPNDIKSIMGGTSNIEFSNQCIDYSATSLNVSAPKAASSDMSLSWKASDTTTLFIDGMGVQTITIKFCKLPSVTPAEWRRINGTLRLTFDARTVNLRGGIASAYKKHSLTIPIDFTYGARLSAKEMRQLYAEERTNVLKRFAQKPDIFRGKNALRRLDNYRFAGYALYELDSLATNRLREHIAPPLPSIGSIYAAEEECTNTDDIKKRLSKNQSVPQSMIEDGGTDCEKVRNYWQNVVGIGRIHRAFAVVNMRSSKQDLIGIVFTKRTQRRPSDTTALAEELNTPQITGVFEPDDIKNIPTRVLETDEETKKMKLVKGSIEGTPFKTMSDYIMESITAGKCKNYTEEVMLFPATGR